MQTHRIGGISSMIEGALYVIGFTVLIAVMGPAMDESISELERLQFVINQKTIYQIWTTLIYVVFGLVLIPLTLSLKHQFGDDFWGAQVSSILGFLWSGLVIAAGMISNIGLHVVATIMSSDPDQALAFWKVIETVHNGLGGGVEIVGGVWVLLLSIRGLRLDIMPKWLHYWGMLVGIAGTLTIVPGLEELGVVFGLSQIVWFFWLGITLYRQK